MAKEKKLDPKQERRNWKNRRASETRALTGTIAKGEQPVGNTKKSGRQRGQS